MRTLVLLAVGLLPALVSAAQVPFTVHGYPAGDGPADLVSNGIPFRPGELTDPRNVRVLDGTVEVPIAIKTLAAWPTDGSIRVALVQFAAPFSGATKSFVLDIGTARTSMGAMSAIVAANDIWKLGESTLSGSSATRTRAASATLRRVSALRPERMAANMIRIMR